MARELASGGYASCSDPGQSVMLRAAAAERQTGLAACLQALQEADSAPASSRQATRCSTPDCRYLVHPDDQFGSFCCCKCFHFGTSGWKPKRKHGWFCIRAEAPAAAQRGPIVPPVWFRQCQQQRAAAAAAAAPIGPAPAPATPCSTGGTGDTGASNTMSSWPPAPPPLPHELRVQGAEPPPCSGALALPRQATAPALAVWQPCLAPGPGRPAAPLVATDCPWAHFPYVDGYPLLPPW